MIISKYGISLTRLTQNEIELVRKKRNLFYIRKNMVDKRIITSKMQSIWFNSINNIFNYYFIIEYDNKKIGLVNGKNIDYESRSSEGGIFIWDQEFLANFIPVFCSIMMNDFTFLINDFNESYIKVLKKNKNAIAYNKQIGYKYLTEEQNFYRYKLTREIYLSKIEKIRKGIGIETGDSTPLSFDNFSFINDSDDDLIKLYQPLPQYLKSMINVGLKREKRTLI